MKATTKFILKKYLQKQRDLIEDAMMTYGSVITKNGRILTVKEMEILFKDKEFIKNLQ